MIFNQVIYKVCSLLKMQMFDIAIRCHPSFCVYASSILIFSEDKEIAQRPGPLDMPVKGVRQHN